MKPKKHRFHLSFDSENLAFPEIHTGTVDESADETPPSEAHPEHVTVQLDNVAVPEVHIAEDEESQNDVLAHPFSGCVGFFALSALTGGRRNGKIYRIMLINSGVV